MPGPEIKIALVLIATEKELHRGQVRTCIDQYIRSVSESRRVDIIITFNTKVDSSSLNYIKTKKNVNSLSVYDCGIPSDEDIYTHDENNEIVQELGQSNGPNQSFYRSLEYIKYRDHDYFMIIEADTRPIGEYWLDRLIEYCNKTKQYVIGGSRYKGSQELPAKSDWRDHLNGVALYRNCDELLDIIKGSKELLYRYIHEKNFARLNYDIAIWYFVNSPAGGKYLPRVIDTNIIANYSLPSDTTIKTQTILDKHPHTVILHQKQ